MSFDPDAYLASKSPSTTGGATEEFDPDAYLASREDLQDGPLDRGIKNTGFNSKMTAQLALNDTQGLADTVKEAHEYNQANPGMPEGKKLYDAYEKGDGFWDGVGNTVKQIGDDYTEAKGFIPGVKKVGRDFRAMGEGVITQLPNAVAPMVGTFGGAALGAAAGSEVPVVGNVAGAVVGSLVGGSAGNALVEGGGQVQDGLQKAGIDASDTQAVKAYLDENRGQLLKQTGIKGGVLGVVDTVTGGAAHALLTGPLKSATTRALTALGIDEADHAAVAAAKKSGAIDALVKNDEKYLAAQKGAENIARNAGAAALEPVGEFTGEYFGQGLASDDWDTKNAGLEALSSIGQSAGTFGVQKAIQYGMSQGGAQNAAEPSDNPTNPNPANPGSGDGAGVDPLARPDEARSRKQQIQEEIDLIQSKGSDATQEDLDREKRLNQQLMFEEANERIAREKIKVNGQQNLTNNSDGASQDAINLSEIAGQLPPQKPSERMGLDPNAGALSDAAALSVDSGASGNLFLPGEDVIPWDDPAATNGAEQVNPASQWDAMDATQRASVLTSVDGMSDRNGNPNVIANRLSQLNWHNMPLGAQEKVNSAITANVAAPVNNLMQQQEELQPASSIYADQENQNRDRGRADSLAQMAGIKNDPDYDRLGRSQSPSTGAPMVFAPKETLNNLTVIGHPETVTGSDGRKIQTQYAVVEASELQASHDVSGNQNPVYSSELPSGNLKALNNGRTAGIQAAYTSGNADNYKAALIGDADRLGVDPNAIAAMKQPVLVRTYDEANNKGDMGAWSNASEGLRLSAAEQANNDARVLGDLHDVVLDDDGKFSPTKNMNLIHRFVNSLPSNEAAALRKRDGSVNLPAVEKRIQHAMLAIGFNNDDLINAATEDTEQSRNLMSALTQSAAGFAKLPAQAAIGTKRLVVRAAEMYQKARESGTSVEQLGRQQDLMGGYSAHEEAIADYMEKNIRAPKKVAMVLGWLADYENQAHQSQGSMFGDDLEATKDAAIAYANQRIKQELGNDANLIREQPATTRQQPATDHGRGTGATTGAHEGATERAGRSGGAAFGLTSQTEQQLAEQEAAQAAAKEEAAQREKAAQDKANADAEVGQFTLTGSDRAADVAAAQGQQDIFSGGRREPETPDHATRWQSMSIEDRKAVLKQEGGWPTQSNGLSVIGQQLAQQDWSKLPSGMRDKIQGLMDKTESSQQKTQPAPKQNPETKAVLAEKPEAVQQKANDILREGFSDEQYRMDSMQTRQKIADKLKNAQVSDEKGIKSLTQLWMARVVVGAKQLNMLPSEYYSRFMEGEIKRGEAPDDDSSHLYSEKDDAFGGLSSEQVALLESLGLLSKPQQEVFRELGENQWGERYVRPAGYVSSTQRGNEEVDLRGEKHQFLSDFEASVTGRGSALARAGVLAEIRKLSERVSDILQGRVTKTHSEILSPLGPFKGYEVRANIERDGVSKTLHVEVYGKEQIEAGLTDEPALLFTVSENGEFIVNGPNPNSETFREFQKRGWAEHAHDKAGNIEPDYTRLTPTPGHKTMPMDQLKPLLADVHARVRAWRKEDQVGLYWVRSTGATGGVLGRETAVFFQKGKGTKQGAVNPTTKDITLSEKDSDASTFLHETGHIFLETQIDMAGMENAGAVVKHDADTVLKWFGIAGNTMQERLAAWNAMTLEEKRQFHEQYAESFEQYLMEGKAPSKDLQSAFDNFRRWLKQVYKSIKAFLASHEGAKLNDDVRAVFDRLLATEEQIQEMEKARNAKALAGEKPLLANPAETKAFEEAAQTVVDNVASGNTEIGKAKEPASILNTSQSKYIAAQAKEQGIKKGSPGYDAAIKKLESNYEEDLNKALAALPFEQFHEWNVKDGSKSENMNRKAWEALREEYGTKDVSGSNVEPVSDTKTEMDRIAKEREELTGRAEEWESRIDAMTDEQAKGLFDAMNLAGSKSLDIKEALKEEHPDDLDEGYEELKQSNKTDLVASKKEAAKPVPTTNRNEFSIERYDREKDAIVTDRFERGEYVRAMISNNKPTFGEIDGVSHTRNKVSIDGVWYSFGSIYKAERPAEPEKKNMAPLSKVIEKANEKYGEGLTEFDRVPEQYSGSKTPAKTSTVSPSSSPEEGQVSQRKTLEPGDVFVTLSGRHTTPFPKYSLKPSAGQSTKDNKKILAWLKENAIAEAQARNDKFNLLQFEGLNINNWSTADGYSVNLYMFGDEHGELAPFRVDETRPSSSKENAKRDANASGTRQNAKQEPKNATNKIEDFGEKLEGARKDYAQKLKEAKAVDVAAVPLSQSWPEPNYDKLLKGGADPLMVGFVRALREELPTKPKKGWKLNGWVDKVKSLRTFAEELLSGEIAPDNLVKTLNPKNEQESIAGRIAASMLGKAEMYKALGHEATLKDFDMRVGTFDSFMGESYSPAKRVYYVEKDKRTPVAWGKTLEEAVSAFVKKQSESSTTNSEKKTEFGLWREGNSGQYFWGKKLGKNYVKLVRFNTLEEAKAYKKTEGFQAEMESLLEKYKTIPFERRKENEPRVGDDHRNGAAVTPEAFSEAFKFRGVQFGNYVEGSRRQQDLDNAYDALSDLAAALDIPTQAISLNGKLGLAFGARGKGGKNAAAAHFEPAKVVINLTKESGAGSLAHEWFHALDNYFAKLDGGTGEFVTNGDVNPLVPNIRPEVLEAFNNVIKAINDSGMPKRAKQLDGRRSKDYWSGREEMAARAFESYIIGKLHEQNAANDYLANIVGEDYWKASEALAGHENADTYPYPTVSEMESIGKAFDHLFDTIQTKEGDDGNVALFNRNGNDAESQQELRDEKEQTFASGLPHNLPTEETAASRALENKINGWRARRGDIGRVRVREVSAVSLPKQLHRALARFTDTTGTRVVLFRNLTPEVDDFGGVNFRDGTLYINENSQNPITLTAAHEWVHNLKKTNPSAYQELENEVRRQGRLDAWHERNIKEEGFDRGRDHAIEELTAAAVSDALTDPVFLQKLAERDQSAFRRIAKAFLEFLKTLTTSWKDQGSNAYLQDVEAFRDKLVQVLDELPVAKQKPGVIKALFLRVFHGTPHRGIEQEGFKLNKIGTGEGAQAYGWGLYFAGNKEVAEYYRQALTQTYGLLDSSGNPVKMVTQDESAALAFVQANGHDFDKGIADLKEVAKTKPRFAAAVPIVERWKADGFGFGFKAGKEGQLYKVEIPEDDAYLLWDKPLIAQSEKVKAALRSMDNRVTFGKDRESVKQWIKITGDIPPEMRAMTGGALYSHIAGKLNARHDSPKTGSQQASEYLQSLGIPGLRYLDGVSRHRPLKDIKREFLAELPEDADFADVVELLGTGALSPKNEALVRALAADEWLGFDYPAQAISAALDKDLSNFDASPALRQAVADAQEGGTHNYVIWDENLLTPEAAKIEPMFSRESDDETLRKEFSDTEKAYGGEVAYEKAKADGKTKLNYRQWVQVRTPRFKEWFGDWENDPKNASKVVAPETGEPMVVYHGSPDLRFLSEDGEFKSQKGRLGFGRDQGAHWFAASERTAKSYADPRRAFDYQRAEEGVIAAYIKLVNPLVVDGKGQKWRDAQKSGKTSGVIEEARKGGHDGAIIKNVRDNYQTGVVGGDQATDTYVVWDSSQIKSATDNSGAFDGSNPDIRYSRQNEVSGFSVADIKDSLSKTFGHAADKLQRLGLVTVVQTEKEAMDLAYKARAEKAGKDLSDFDVKYSETGDVQGFYDKQTGKSFLVADNLTDETASSVLVHEVGVHMAADTTNPRGKQAMDKMIQRAGNLLKLEKSAFMDSVRQRMKEAGETSNEEAAAYIAEEYEANRANAPSAVVQWVKDFIAAVRGWLFQRGVIVKDNMLTAADIAAIARSNVKQAAKRNGIVGLAKTQQARNVVQEPGERYETDLFGNALPPANKRRAPANTRPESAGVSGDIQPATPLSDTEAPAGDYFVRTIVGQEVARKLGASRITTPEEAAQATQYLYKSAVERLDGIVTDKNGKPLGVVGGFKGELASSSVYPSTIVAEAIRIPGAAAIWFSHNHPSGLANLSSADINISRKLTDIFRGSGIEPMGLLSVAGDMFDYVDADGDKKYPTKIPAPESSAVRVPVIERELGSENSKQYKIEHPQDAIHIGELMRQKGGDGIMLLSSQNEVVAWVPISDVMRGDLRDTGGLAAIYRAISEANAGAAVIVHGGMLEMGHPSDRSITVGQNIAAALSNIDVRVLDIVDSLRMVSSASTGADIARGPVYSRKTSVGLHYSRAAVKQYANRAASELNKTFSSPNTLNWWHKTVGTMYNLAERSPAFKRVFDAAQGFIDDVSHYANDAADFAPTILPKLEKWSDIAKTSIASADNKAIEKPIHEGTLAWTRREDGSPVKVEDLIKESKTLSTDDKIARLLRSQKLQRGVLKMWQGMSPENLQKRVDSFYDKHWLKAGVVWNDSELKQMFGLNDKQVGLYKEYRAAIDRSLDTLARADMLRFVGEDAKDIKDAVMDADNIRDAAAMLTQHLMRKAKEDTDREKLLMELVHGIHERHDKVNELQKEGYAPLSRFGKYTVDVVDPDTSERQYFSMFETKREANAMAEAMRKEFGDKAVSQGTLSDEAYKLFSDMSPETLELFGNMLGLESTGDNTQDIAFQEYLKLTKTNRSAMRRLIHRQGIVGYSQDMPRILANFVYSNARQTAAGLNMGEMGEALNAIPKAQGELKDAAIRLADYVKNPREEAQAVRGLLFAQYLGGSVASAMVNMTQPFAVSFPYLTQFTSVKDSAAQLGRAAKELAQRNPKYDPELTAALHRAVEDGVVAPQEIHQLMAQARGSGTLSIGDGTKTGEAAAAAKNAVSKLAFGWGKVFSMAEQVNRQMTFVAAYRIAKAKGMDNAEAFARKAVVDTQFQYSKANKMQWGRGAVGGTLMTFKTYSIAYVELLHRMYTQGGPEGKRAALLALGVLMLMGGASGLPFEEDMEDVAEALAQKLGYNISIKQKRQEFLSDVFGNGMANFIENGITGLPGIPIDVSGRLGMGNLIPGTGLLKTKTDHTRDVLEIAGPIGDFASRVGSGAGRILSGDVLGGALEMSPVAIRNAVKGIDMASTGMYRDQKGYKVLDTNLVEAASKAIGFQPQSVARIQEANAVNQQQKAFYNLRAGEIRGLWAQGIFEKDASKVADARSQIADWNAKNPDQRMLISIPSVMRRVKEMSKTKDQRIAASAPRVMRAKMRDDVAEILNER